MVSPCAVFPKIMPFLAWVEVLRPLLDSLEIYYDLVKGYFPQCRALFLVPTYKFSDAW